MAAQKQRLAILYAHTEQRGISSCLKRSLPWLDASDLVFPSSPVSALHASSVMPNTYWFYKLYSVVVNFGVKSSNFQTQKMPYPRLGRLLLVKHVSHDYIYSVQIKAIFIGGV